MNKLEKKTVWFPVAEGGQGGYYSQERYVFSADELKELLKDAYLMGYCDSAFEDEGGVSPKKGLSIYLTSINIK